MENNEVLKLSEVTKIYKNKCGIKNISFRIDKKDILGVVGKSGSGKSTLLKTIVGLSELTTGEIEILNSKSKKELNNNRRYIGSSINNPSFYEYMTAFENLKYLSIVRGIASTDKDLYEILESVDLYEERKKKISEFSLGMKRRFALASALIGNPSILILDEITNGLDPINIAKFKDLIKKLNYEREVTIVLASHALEELATLATKYLFINEGSVKEFITVEELNKKFRTHIEVKTFETKKAVVVLEEILNINEYIVMEGDIIQIFERLDEIDIVSKELILNAVPIHKIDLKSEGLEGYFIELMGGKGNA